MKVWGVFFNEPTHFVCVIHFTMYYNVPTMRTHMCTCSRTYVVFGIRDRWVDTGWRGDGAVATETQPAPMFQVSLMSFPFQKDLPPVVVPIPSARDVVIIISDGFYYFGTAAVPAFVGELSPKFDSGIFFGGLIGSYWNGSP